MTDATRRSWVRRPTGIIALCVLLAAALASGTLAAAPGGGIRGKITGWEKLLPQVYAEATKNDSRRSTWREPSPTVKQDFRKLSANVSRDVCVALLGGGTAPAHEPTAVKLTGGRFTPSTIVLSPGSRLSLKNVDPFAHVLYEMGSEKWTANSVAPGSSREWAASAPGLHVIRDELFPSVVMYVVVDPAALEFALPDHEGAFSIAAPQGDYTLKVFFDGRAVAKEAPIHLGNAVVEMREPVTVGGGEAK